MSYELFRIEMITGLTPLLAEEKMKDVVNVIDNIALSYDFSKKEMSLSVVGVVPEVVKMFVAAKATQRLAQDTLQNYYLNLKNFFSAVCKPVDRIDSNDIRAYLFNYQKIRGISDRTLDEIRIELNTFFEWCVNNINLASNPCKNVDPIRYYAKQREIYKPNELELARANCRTIREKAIIDLLYSSGIRVTELCNLKITDINLYTMELTVRCGKGKKDRITYINAEAAVSFKMYLNTRTDNCEYAIVNIRGKEKHRIGKKSIERVVKNVSSRAGIDPGKSKPHNLRHTFATTLLQNGCPIQHVQRMLGHSKISTTMIYTTICDNDVRQSYNKCSM